MCRLRASIHSGDLRQLALYATTKRCVEHETVFIHLTDIKSLAIDQQHGLCVGPVGHFGRMCHLVSFLTTTFVIFERKNYSLIIEVCGAQLKFLPRSIKGM